jgi:hypothetical protein
MRYVEHSTVATEEDSVKDVDPKLSRGSLVTPKKNKWGSLPAPTTCLDSPHL